MWFKRILTVALLGATTLSWASATNKYDVNNDGKIDGRDAEALVAAIGFAGAQGSMPAPAGSAFDLNGDGQYSLADWREFTGYLTSVGLYPDALFDVTVAFKSGAVLNVNDRMAITQAVTQGRGGYYSMRYDFNADGRVDLNDWALFSAYLMRTAPALLLDVDGSGVFNGRDLDQLAQAADIGTYDVGLDLNSDGSVNASDWRVAVQLAMRTNPKAMFDAKGQSASIQPIINSSDAQRIASALSGLSVGFPVSLRFDFNGDGVVTPKDWTEWVRFATLVYKTPDLLFDVNGDGYVNAADLAIVSASVGSLPVQISSDLNGDGLVDARDVALLTMRLTLGPVQMLQGDVDRDNCVTTTDFALVQAAQGATSNTVLYDPDLDITQNGYVGPEDLAIVGGNRGRCR